MLYVPLLCTGMFITIAFIVLNIARVAITKNNMPFFVTFNPGMLDIHRYVSMVVYICYHLSDNYVELSEKKYIL